MAHEISIGMRGTFVCAADNRPGNPDATRNVPSVVDLLLSLRPTRTINIQMSLDNSPLPSSISLHTLGSVRSNVPSVTASRMAQSETAGSHMTSNLDGLDRDDVESTDQTELPDEFASDGRDVMYADGGYGWVVTAGKSRRTLWDLILRRVHVALSAAGHPICLGRLPSGARESSTWELCCLELDRRDIWLLHRSRMFTCEHAESVIDDDLRQGSLVVARLGPRVAALISVLVASSSLLLSSFLTRHVVGLIMVHGVIFGLASALGYIVRFDTTAVSLD